MSSSVSSGIQKAVAVVSAGKGSLLLYAGAAAAILVVAAAITHHKPPRKPVTPAQVEHIAPAPAPIAHQEPSAEHEDAFHRAEDVLKRQTEEIEQIIRGEKVEPTDPPPPPVVPEIPVPRPAPKKVAKPAKSTKHSALPCTDQRWFDRLC